MVESKVYLDAVKKPAHVEINLITRRADGSPAPKQFVKIPWPT